MLDLKNPKGTLVSEIHEGKYKKSGSKPEWRLIPGQSQRILWCHVKMWDPNGPLGEGVWDPNSPQVWEYEIPMAP